MSVVETCSRWNRHPAAAHTAGRATQVLSQNAPENADQPGLAGTQTAVAGLCHRDTPAVIQFEEEVHY
jgi:hypothetical protein